MPQQLDARTDAGAGQRGIRTPMILAGITLLGFVLRLIGIASQSLWTDEVGNLIFAEKSLAQILGMVAFLDVNPPLSYILLHFWLALGKSDAFVRVLPVLLGTVTIPMVFFLGRRFFGGAVGLIGALLLAVTPLAVYLSQEVRYFALAGLMATVWLIQLDKLDEDPWDRKREGWFILVTWLGLLTHYYLFFLVAAGAIHFAISNRHEPRRIRRLAWLILKTCAYYLPWFFAIGMQFGRESFQFRSAMTPWDALFDLVSHLFLGHSDRMLPSVLPLLEGLPRQGAFRIGFAVLLLPFVLALFAGMGAKPSDEHARRGRGLMLWALLLPVIATLILTVWLPLYRYHYFIAVLPVAVLFMARGIVALHARSKGAGALLILLILALQGLSLLEFHTDSKYWREDWRGLAAAVAQRSQPGDAVVTYTRESCGAFHYYWKGEIPVLQLLTTKPFHFQQEPQREIFSKMNYYSGQFRRFWFLSYYGHMFDPAGYLKAYFDQNLVRTQNLEPDHRIAAALYYVREQDALADLRDVLSDAVVFGSGGFHPVQAARGFYEYAEEDRWAWMADEAVFNLLFKPGARTLKLVVLLNTDYLPPPVRLTVTCEDLGNWNFVLNTPQTSTLRLSLPETEAAPEVLTCRLRTDRFFRPADVIGGDDTSKKSILVSEIRLE